MAAGPPTGEVEGWPRPWLHRFHKMAESLGCYGELVEQPDGIRPALERAFASGGPAVVNVVTDFKARATTQQFSVYST